MSLPTRAVRYSFINRLILAGAPMHPVKDAAEHATIETRMKYVYNPLTLLRKAVDRRIKIKPFRNGTGTRRNEDQ
jgi:hypothetical protein